MLGAEFAADSFSRYRSDRLSVPLHNLYHSSVSSAPIRPDSATVTYSHEGTSAGEEWLLKGSLLETVTKLVEVSTHWEVKEDRLNRFL